MSEQTREYYSLKVVRVEGAKKKRDTPGYVEIKTDKTVHETGHIDDAGVPSWNTTFTLEKLDTIESLCVSLRQERKVIDDYRVGQVEVNVAELVQTSDTDVRKCLNPESAGCVYLRLEKLSASELSDRALMHIESAEKSVERVKNLSDKVQCMGVVGSVIDALDDIVEVIDEIAGLHSFLNLSWKAISLLYRIVSHQFKTDKDLIKLVECMREAFDFSKNTKGLKDRTEELKPKIAEVLHLAIKCSRFVQEYALHNFFGRLFQRKASEINGYAERFTTHREELDYAIALNVAKGIDDIEARQILDTLMVKAEAPKLATHPRCQEGTRVKLLGDIKDGLFLKGARKMIWLTGAAGSGKSTIAMTVADACDDMYHPPAYLFFERGKDGHASAIRAIADRLATIHKAIKPHIICAIERNKNIVNNTLRRQFEKLLLEPLQKAARTIDKPVIIILDALDESGSRGDREELVQLLKTEFGKLLPIIRILVTSRPEEDITKGLQSIDHVEPIRLDHDSEDSKGDVSRYLREEMMKAVDQQTPEHWSRDKISRVLSEAAGGLFIWASTAVKMVRDSVDRVERLKSLLENIPSVGGGIDDLYSTVLEQSGITLDPQCREIIGRVLGFVLFSKEALSSSSIAAFFGLKERTVNAILGRLTSVVHYEPGQPIRLHHASFADYLTQRSSDKPWKVDEPEGKKVIAERCFDTMRDKLRFNIGDIPTSFVLNVDVPGIKDRVKKNIPWDLDYACRFWSDHFCELPVSDGLLDRLRTFAYRDLLYWFEVLSLRGCFARVATGAIRGAFMKIASTHADLSSFLWHACRMAIIFAKPISQSVPQIYLSAISLWRGESRVADHYSKTHPVVRVHQVGNKLPVVCMAVLEVGSGVSSIALSPDGKRIVSGSEDGKIRVWDADSGALVVGPFTGHIKAIKSVAYSPNGNRIVSGSADKTIRVWDADTGALVADPFTGHTDWITSVAYSHDGNRVVSGSHDKTVRVWDADTGALVAGPFTGHTWSITSVAFSPDGRRIVSGSDDKTVRVWDADTGALVAGPFTGHTWSITSVAFSPDGGRIVSGSDDETIRVWDADTGALVAGPFTGHTHWIRSVAYSPDGNRIVSGSRDNTMRVWDADTGALVAGPFTGHTGEIDSVAYSPDGRRIVSGSLDETIRVWDADAGVLVAGPFTGHTGRITSVAYSPDGNRIVSGSDDKTVRVWDVDTGALVAGPFTGHTGAITSVAYSPDGRRIVSGSVDNTIRMWDADTGTLVAGPFAGHTGWITSVALSPDGNRVASGSLDKKIRVWDADTGTLIAGPFAGHTKAVRSVAYSPDGRRIVSGSDDKTIRVWDADTGALVACPFRGHTKSIRSVAYSPDGNRIVSGSLDKKIRVWDADTGTLVAGPFAGHTKAIRSVAYSPDGNRVVSGSTDKTIRVWNVSNDDVSTENIGPPESASSSILNWELREDGWVQGARGELLTWVPEDIHGTLLRARNTALFSCQFSTRLNFVSSRLGEDWRKGFPRLPEPDSQGSGATGDEDAAGASGEGTDVGGEIAPPFYTYISLLALLSAISFCVHFVKPFFHQRQWPVER